MSLSRTRRASARTGRWTTLAVVAIYADCSLSSMSDGDSPAVRRATLEREVEAASTVVPTVGEMAGWVRTRLCRRDPGALLRHAASRATIDERDVLRVEIPWRASENLLETGVSAAQKIGERPAHGQFAEVKFGSPYQIRTGDLRLERAAS